MIRAVGISAFVAIVLAMPIQDAAAQDPVGGAIVGGATGAIIGGVLGGGRGAAIGAIVGGVTGAAIAVDVAPPPLPVYDQPPIPAPGYIWTPGYWASEVGFYGGVSYGFGYTGVGYEGGYWRGGTFFYNRTVNNISNVQITNVYNKTVVN